MKKLIIALFTLVLTFGGLATKAKTHEGPSKKDTYASAPPINDDGPGGGR